MSIAPSSPAPVSAPARRGAAVVDAMHSPLFEWTRTPRQRRRLVLVSVLLSMIFVATLASSGWQLEAGARVSALVLFGVAFVLLLAWMGVTACLNASLRGAADPLMAQLPGALDEWQSRLHADVYRRCYWPSLALLSVVMLSTIVTRPSVVTALAAFLLAFTAAVMVPLWTMAWTLTADLREELATS
jgi:hypothetical protein